MEKWVDARNSCAQAVIDESSYAQTAVAEHSYERTVADGGSALM